MTRVVFAPETFNLAETTRAIEIARHLPEADVLFTGYSRAYAPLVEEAGFAFRMLSPELSASDGRQLIKVDQGRALRHPFTESVIRARVRSEMAAFESFGADAVVIGTTLSTFISARASGVPLVHAKPFAYSLPHLSRATSFPVLPDGRAAGRAANRIAAGLVRAAAPRLTFRPRAFRTVPGEFGVRLPRQTLAALDADVNLITELRALHGARAPELPPNYRLVGPIYARLPGEVPDRVKDLANGRRPVVYLALGSSGNRRLLLRLLAALADCPVEVLAPVRQYLGPADLAAVPGNVHVTDLLPAHRLAPFIDLSVIHGGQGTVQTACLSGKPFVGVPLQFEQRYNVAACVRYGNAVQLSPHRLTPRRVREAVRACLQSAGLRDRAAELAREAAGEDGALASADHIRALIAGGAAYPPHG
ncbi:glycosyltransferase [Streptomyces marincola]|uniref:Erythromycin biosynthesis protein CIII-like C-terminal domain-containing protein n=1 Tax=Streptomyces marincola TaxID=2878388 RepID=A0A1W7D106_9ACTN|nr:nucleotide disphospho-sugar-binding domain-containing protein [Streptomyces marincola]ARQ70738.1 hypothetical protein CAG99_19535 [Streptomyces marincola]